MRKQTRRQFLVAGAGLAMAGLAGLVAAGCNGQGSPDGTQSLPEDLFDFPQPEQRLSSGGILDTQLVVNFAENFVGDFRLYTRTYEGTIPGPTLRLRQGDLLRVTQVNDLPANPDEGEVNHNRPHNFNTINFHSHGWHVDPTGQADNIFLQFQPGTTNVTQIQLPGDHHEGTFWYHPHNHGSAAEQICGGMAGLLIVEGPTDLVPEIAAARDVVMVVQNIRVDDDGEVPEFTSSAALRDAPNSFFLVNGVQNPTLTMRPGEVQRWRICHASFREILDLQLDGHSMQQIAMDGLTFPAPVQQDRIYFSPGNRVDVMIKAGEPGSYVLRSIDDGDPGPTGEVAVSLLTLVVEGEPVDMQLPTRLPGTPSLRPITQAEIAASTAGPNGNGKRVINFIATPMSEGFNRSEAFCGPAGSVPPPDKISAADSSDSSFDTAFRIVGTGETPATTIPPGYDPNHFADFSQEPAVCRVPLVAPPFNDPTWGLFDPDVTNHILELNTVEEWTLCGDAHPFHIHVNPFQLVAVDGVFLDPPIWMDTVTPAGRTLTIRMRFTDFRGDAVAHCHVLDHEDTGMMQKISIV